MKYINKLKVTLNGDVFLIFPIIDQFDDIVSWILPIICCLAIPLLQSRGGGSQPVVSTRESDLWYTTQNIDEVYEIIGKEIEGWRVKAAEEKARQKSFIENLKSIGRKKGERFILEKEVSPRLYTLSDPVVGIINFELTEVEAGGTTVKASYGPIAKSRILDFKARSPLKIPVVPIGNNCPSCGKAVLREFLMCPYCGQQLKND